MVAKKCKAMDRSKRGAVAITSVLSALSGETGWQLLMPRLAAPMPGWQRVAFSTYLIDDILRQFQQSKWLIHAAIVGYIA